eukprot:9395571-Alexandrium_andersonii.AAC.1
MRGHSPLYLQRSDHVGIPHDQAPVHGPKDDGPQLRRSGAGRDRQRRSRGHGAGVHGRDLGVGAELRVCADSSAAIGICCRSGIGRARRLA